LTPFVEGVLTTALCDDYAIKVLAALSDESMPNTLMVLLLI